MVDKREYFTVIRDFTHTENTPLGTHVYEYRVGDDISLRVGGSMYNEWMDRGYIERRCEIGCIEQYPERH